MKQKIVALAKVCPDIEAEASEFIKNDLLREIERFLNRARIFGIKPIYAPEYNESFHNLDDECQEVTLFRIVQRTKGSGFGYFLEEIFYNRSFPWHYLLPSRFS